MIVHPRTGPAAVLLGLTSLMLFTSACDPPGKPKAEESQAEDREAIMDFKVLYESNCAGCHGSNGINGPARTLNQPLYLAILHRDDLRKILVYGRPGTAMPAWAKSQGGPLVDKQIDALVDGMYTNWAKPERFARIRLLPYEGTGTGDPNHGKKLFLRACFICHGKGAAVGPVTDVSYASLASNQYVRSAILAGRPDLGMPDYRTINLGRPLSDSDVNDLVAYVSSFRPAAITAQMSSMPSGQPGAQLGASSGGEQASPSGTHEDESGTGESRSGVKGNEGSGNGPGSPRPTERQEGNKGKGSSSQGGVK